MPNHGKIVDEIEQVVASLGAKRDRSQHHQFRGIKAPQSFESELIIPSRLELQAQLETALHLAINKLLAKCKDQQLVRIHGRVLSTDLKAQKAESVYRRPTTVSEFLGLLKTKMKEPKLAALLEKKHAIVQAFFDDLGTPVEIRKKTYGWGKGTMRKSNVIPDWTTCEVEEAVEEQCDDCRHSSDVAATAVKMYEEWKQHQPSAWRCSTHRTSTVGPTTPQALALSATKTSQSSALRAGFLTRSRT